MFYHVAWVRKKTEESSTNRDHDSGNCQHIWDLYWLLLWYMQSILRNYNAYFAWLPGCWQGLEEKITRQWDLSISHEQHQGVIQVSFYFFIRDGDRAEKGLCYGFYGMPGTLFTFKIRSPARRIIKIANSTLSAYKQALTSSSHSTQHWHLSLVQDHHRHSFLWSLELSPVIFRGLDYVEQP